MQPLGSGLWPDPKGKKGMPVVHGWIDFAVKNYDYHKKMAVKVSIERENGALEEFLYRPRFRGMLPDGRERWGTDASELFPDHGPHGKITDVRFSYCVQADADGDGDRDLCVSKNAYRLADRAELVQAKAGKVVRPAPKAARANPDYGARVVDTSAAAGASKHFKDTIPPIEVYFASAPK